MFRLPNHMTFGCDATDKHFESNRLHRLSQVYPSMRRENFLSKRAYEYFCTIYINEHLCVSYGVNLLKSYQTALSKQKLSFYCRKTAPPIFHLQVQPDVSLVVNTPLLNFLNWVAENRVDEFMLANKEAIKSARMLYDTQKQKRNVPKKSLIVWDDLSQDDNDDVDDLTKRLQNWLPETLSAESPILKAEEPEMKETMPHFVLPEENANLKTPLKKATKKATKTKVQLLPKDTSIHRPVTRSMKKSSETIMTVEYNFPGGAKKSFKKSIK